MIYIVVLAPPRTKRGIHYATDRLARAHHEPYVSSRGKDSETGVMEPFFGADGKGNKCGPGNSDRGRNMRVVQGAEAHVGNGRGQRRRAFDRMAERTASGPVRYDEHMTTTGHYAAMEEAVRRLVGPVIAKIAQYPKRYREYNVWALGGGTAHLEGLILREMITDILTSKPSAKVSLVYIDPSEGMSRVAEERIRTAIMGIDSVRPGASERLTIEIAPVFAEDLLEPDVSTEYPGLQRSPDLVLASFLDSWLLDRIKAWRNLEQLMRSRRGSRLISIEEHHGSDQLGLTPSSILDNDDGAKEFIAAVEEIARPNHIHPTALYQMLLDMGFSSPQRWALPPIAIRPQGRHEHAVYARKLGIDRRRTASGSTPAVDEEDIDSDIDAGDKE